MNPPHAANADALAFSLWPDAPAASEEEMIAWALAVGYSQPEPTVEGSSFDTLDPTFSWGQSGTTPTESFGFQTGFDTDWTSEVMAAMEMPSHGVPLPDATSLGTTFAPAPAPPFPTDDTTDAYSIGSFFTQPDFTTSFSDTPSSTDVSSLPTPQSDVTGDPIPTFGAPPSFVPTSGFPSSHVDLAGASHPNQFTYAAPYWLMEGGGTVGQAPFDYTSGLDSTSMYDHMSVPGFSAQPDCFSSNHYLAAPTVAPATMVTNETGVPSHSLGKRKRISEGNGSGRQKRSRPEATWVPEGAESTKRTRRSLDTRTQQTINGISKVAGCGAEMLASTTAQGVYHRSLPGLSVPQGSVGALEQGKLPWIEGREQVEMRLETGSAQQQQIVLQSVEDAEDGENLYKIPGDLSKRERLMLQTTPADDERGAVRIIKCKLCPKARIGTWVTFKRHCKSSEKHPQKLTFCPTCGDYFARGDSASRHKDKKYQEACRSTSQDEAKEKKQEVERLLKAFEARLNQCLTNGEEIGALFSDVMAKRLTRTSTSTSKKVSKTAETRAESASWAAGL